MSRPLFLRKEYLEQGGFNKWSIARRSINNNEVDPDIFKPALLERERELKDIDALVHFIGIRYNNRVANGLLSSNTNVKSARKVMQTTTYSYLQSTSEETDNFQQLQPNQRRYMMKAYIDYMYEIINSYDSAIKSTQTKTTEREAAVTSSSKVQVLAPEDYKRLDEIEKLRTDIDASNAAIEAMEVDNTRKRERDKKIEERDAKQQQLEQLEKEVPSLPFPDPGSQEASSVPTDDSAESQEDSSLKGTIAQLRIEKEQCEEIVQTLQEEVNRLTNELKSSQEEVYTLEAEVASEKGRVAGLETNLNESIQKNALLQYQLNDELQQLNGQKADNNSLREKLKNVRKKAADLKKEIKDDEQVITGLKEELETVRRERDENDDISTLLDETNIDYGNDPPADTLSQVEFLIKKYEEHTQKIARLNEQLKAEQEPNDVNKEAQLEAQIARLKAELKAAKDQVDLDSSNAQLLKNIDEQLAGVDEPSSYTEVQEVDMEIELGEENSLDPNIARTKKIASLLNESGTLNEIFQLTHMGKVVESLGDIKSILTECEALKRKLRKCNVIKKKNPTEEPNYLDILQGLCTGYNEYKKENDDANKLIPNEIVGGSLSEKVNKLIEFYNIRGVIVKTEGEEGGPEVNKEGMEDEYKELCNKLKIAIEKIHRDMGGKTPIDYVETVSSLYEAYKECIEEKDPTNEPMEDDDSWTQTIADWNEFLTKEVNINVNFKVDERKDVKAELVGIEDQLKDKLRTRIYQLDNAFKQESATVINRDPIQRLVSEIDNFYKTGNTKEILERVKALIPEIKEIMIQGTKNALYRQILERYSFPLPPVYNIEEPYLKAIQTLDGEMQKAFIDFFILESTYQNKSAYYENLFQSLERDYNNLHGGDDVANYKGRKEQIDKEIKTHKLYIWNIVQKLLGNNKLPEKLNFKISTQTPFNRKLNKPGDSKPDKGPRTINEEEELDDAEELEQDPCDDPLNGPYVLLRDVNTIPSKTLSRPLFVTNEVGTITTQKEFMNALISGLYYSKNVLSIESWFQNVTEATREQNGSVELSNVGVNNLLLYMGMNGYNTALASILMMETGTPDLWLKLMLDTLQVRRNLNTAPVYAPKYDTSVYMSVWDILTDQISTYKNVVELELKAERKPDLIASYGEGLDFYVERIRVADDALRQGKLKAAQLPNKSITSTNLEQITQTMNKVTDLNTKLSQENSEVNDKNKRQERQISQLLQQIDYYANAQKAQRGLNEDLTNGTDQSMINSEEVQELNKIILNAVKDIVTELKGVENRVIDEFNTLKDVLVTMDQRNYTEFTEKLEMAADVMNKRMIALEMEMSKMNRPNLNVLMDAEEECGNPFNPGEYPGENDDALYTYFSSNLRESIIDHINKYRYQGHAEQDIVIKCCRRDYEEILKLDEFTITSMQYDKNKKNIPFQLTLRKGF